MKQTETHSLYELIDKHVGASGSPERDQFEKKLQLEVLTDQIRQLRKNKQLSQAQLGELIGVGKAQISKIENSISDARLSTLLRVFEALETDIYFRLQAKTKKP